MEDFDTKYGVFIRMLMVNTNKGRTTRKADVREELKIDNSTMQKLILFSKEKVALLGFGLIGVDKNNIVDSLQADKYYLIRSLEEGDVSNNTDEPSDSFRKMIVIFNLVLLENNKISLKRLVFLCNKIKTFAKEDIEGFVRYVKKEGYLEIVKEETDLYVEVSWRFNAEFDKDCFLCLKRIYVILWCRLLAVIGGLLREPLGLRLHTRSCYLKRGL